jgi:hypothetical protein
VGSIGELLDARAALEDTVSGQECAVESGTLHGLAGSGEGQRELGGPVETLTVQGAAKIDEDPAQARAHSVWPSRAGRTTL